MRIKGHTATCSGWRVIISDGGLFLGRSHRYEVGRMDYLAGGWTVMSLNDMKIKENRTFIMQHKS